MIVNDGVSDLAYINHSNGQWINVLIEVVICENSVTNDHVNSYYLLSPSINNYNL